MAILPHKLTIVDYAINYTDWSFCLDSFSKHNLSLISSLTVIGNILMKVSMLWNED